MKLRITLTAVLVAALAAPVLAQMRFPDIGGHSRVADITYVSDRGWFGGYEDGSFKPNRTITAAQ